MSAEPHEQPAAQPDTAQPGQKPPRALRAAALSALEEALHQALAAAPPEEVLGCVTATWPKAGVSVHVNPPVHGKVRKVSVSLPAELTEAVRARTGAGGFSRYVTEAVQTQLRQDLLEELLRDLEEQHGPIPPEIMAETRRLWPDWEE